MDPDLTFNPGLISRMERLEQFLDVRKIETRLREAGIDPVSGVEDDNPEGPAHITLVDPDGNSILIDQFS